MTYSEGAKFIGRGADIELGGLSIYVTVTDFKQSYGKDRWLVSPVCGKGEIWVENVTVRDEQE